MDAEPVGLVFCGRSLLAEPQMKHVEGTRAKAHGSYASVFLRGDESGVLEDSQMLHQRRQRHREGRRELGHDGRGLRQPFDDGPASRIRDGAEDDVEVIAIVRHTPNYRVREEIRQPGLATYLRL